MGLRCLLGHDFDEPELRREREEDGNEVVTTVTEVKTCARCGETQVVSENTEVTTMEQLTDEATAAGDERTDPDAGPESGSAGTGVSGGDTGGVKGGTGGVEVGPDAGTTAAVGVDDDDAGDDAVIIDDGPEPADDGPAERGAVDAGGAEPEPGAPGEERAPAAGADGETDAADEGDGAELIDDGPADGAAGAGDSLERDEGEYAAYPEAEATEAPADEEHAETDDGVILDEEDDAADDRERGAWPDVDESGEGEGEPTPWPEHGGEDEGFSAEVGDGDAGDVEFGGGLTPEAADAPTDDEDAEYVEAPAQAAGEADAPTGTAGTVDEGAGITRGESPELETSTSDVTTEYYCPECEMTRAADGNSMRAGDICPECKRGYVDERPI
ncbi:DUF7093 family protein [Halorubrum sp. FL23]|uniref:DUF7093 family protein n=1 Tax=Halorubrum sp. FL23 TaxID=3458704 RepID=UPI004033F391